MAENSSIANAISSLTGLPKDQIVNTSNPTGDPIAGAIAALGANPKSIKLNSSRDTSGYDPLQKSAFTIDLTNVYNDPLASYTKYGVPLNPFVDWNEERAQRQSTGQKWVNGLTKAGITTLGALYENTVGVIAGLGSLAMGDSYYDNFVGRQVDEMNEWSQKNLPNYYTKAEQNASVLESLGTANFWADKFANGLGYTVGSIATMFLGVGELGLSAKLGSLAAKGAKGAKILDVGADIANLADDAAKAVGSSQKALYTTVKGIEEAKAVGRGLENLDKVTRIKTATKHLAVGTQMSLAEASVEAREAKKQFMDSEIAKWQEANPGQPVPADVEAAIEASATAAGNVTFGINLPLLTATNLLMFGKTLTGARLGEKAMFDVEKKVSKDAANAGIKWAEKTADSKIGRAFAKAQKNFGPAVENMVTEGFQEGAQFTASEFSRNYYADKFADGSGDMAKAFSEALSHTLGSKEGWENIIIGALVGGGTGVVSRIAGAEKRLLKAKNANTQEAIKILNSGGVSNAIENMEQTTHNLALVKQLDDANAKGDFEAAETARMRIIHNVFAKMNKLGALDYAMEQFEDAASMSEEDFKKAFGYDMKLSLKDQTGKTQAEIIADTKSKMETAIKRSEQVSRILSQYEPGNNLIAKIKEGLQTDETKNNKKIQEDVRNMYGQMLTYHLLDIDSIDSVIGDQYDKLVQLAPALASVPKEDLLYRLKIGEVAIDEAGEIKVTSKSNAAVDTKFKAAIEDVFKGFSVLDDGNNAEDFVNSLNKLHGLMLRRGRLVESFKNLKRNPEQMDLVVEAEMLKRDFEERKASNDRTKQAIQGAQTSEDLEIDEDTDDELKIQAEKKREELRDIEDKKQSEFKKLSDDELMAVDISELEISDPQGAVALSREIAERAMVKAEKAFAEKEAEEEPEDATPLTDAEKNALNEITMDSLSKNEFVIDGKVYYVPETDLEALIEWEWVEGQEDPVAKSVTLFDVQTNKPFTWKIQNVIDTSNALDNIADENGNVDYNKAAQATQDLTTTAAMNAAIEKESATALAIINVLLTEASSIRSAEESDYNTLQDSKQTAMEEGRVAIDSTLETLQKDTNLKNELKQAGLDKNADPYEAAGITSEQLKYQIEELKQHIKDLDATIAKERQIAIEEGISEKEFKKIRAAELLKTREKAFQLLKQKQNSLIARKSEENAREGKEVVTSLPVAPNDAEYGYIIEKASQEISNYENQISELERTVAELDKIINGEYGEQNIDDAKAKKRKTVTAINYRKKKILEKQQIIDTANATRELENRTKDGDTTTGISPTPEGEGVEGTNIDSATRSTTEGLDGSISTEEAERIKQQKADAIETAKKMGVQPTSKEQPKSQGVPSSTIVTDGSNLDVQTVKGSEEIVNGKVLVDEEGNTRQDYTSMVQQTIDGEEVLVFPALLTNPSIAPVGSEIEFEMMADTDWVKTQIPEGKEVNEWLAEGGWKIVPIFMVYNGERLALLKAFDDTSSEGFKGSKRQEIVNVILKGGKATAKVTGKLVDTKSIANTTTSTGESFFYPFTVIKENGKPSSIVYVSLDIANNRRWEVAYVGEGVNPTDATTSSNDLTKLTPGQIGIVTTNPEGAPIIIMASTRDVGEREAAIAIGHITKENPEAAKYSEIVGTSIVPVQSTDGDIEVNSTEIRAELENIPTSGHRDSYTKFIMTYSLEDGRQMFVFYSEAANGLIRIDELNLKLALLGGKPSFSFVQDVVNERGLVTFKSVTMAAEQRAVVEKALGEDFKAVTLKKKMQVDKNLLRLNMESYESPLTGTIYKAEEGLPSPYIQYLSSESEFEGSPRKEGKGSNAILSVDTKVNSQGSVFYDVNLRLGPLRAEGVDMATQDDLDVEAVTDTINSLSFDKKPATTTTTPTDSRVADIERRRREELSKNKIEYGGYNLESESIDVDIVQRPNGTFGVVVSLPNKQSSTGFSNSTALSEEFKTRQEALDYVTTVIIPKAEKLINAKYDAELAALKAKKADIERRKNLIGLQDTVDNETNQLISVTATYVRPFNYSELDSVRPVSHDAYIVNNYGEQKSFDIYEYPDPDKAAKDWLDSKYNAELDALQGQGGVKETTTLGTISNGDRIISVQTKPVTDEITDTAEDLFILSDKNPEGRIHINMEPLKDILVVPNNTLTIIDKTTGKEIVSKELNPEGAVIFEAVQGRLFVVANINGQLVPFYKSSAGTSGKTQGDWYPFFGYTGAWLVKGGIDKATGKMSYSSEIDRVTSLLNENLVFPDKYIHRDTNTIKNTKGEVIIDMNKAFKINRLWQKEFGSQTGAGSNYQIKGLKEDTRSESGLVALITGLNTTALDSSKTPKENSEWFNLISKNAEPATSEGKPATPAVQPVPAATSENAIEAPDTPVGFFRKPGQKPAEKSVSSSPTSGFAALEALGFSQDMFQDAPQDVLDDIEKREQNLQKGEELNKECNKGKK